MHYADWWGKEGSGKKESRLIERGIIYKDDWKGVKERRAARSTQRLRSVNTWKSLNHTEHHAALPHYFHTTAMSLSSAQISVLKEVFYIHEDPSRRSGPIRDSGAEPTGQIKRSNLLQFLRALGLPFTQQDVEEYTTQYNIKGSYITFTNVVTLVTAWKNASHPDPCDAVSTLFKACVPQHNKITVKTLHDIVCNTKLTDRVTSADFYLVVTEMGFTKNSLLTLSDVQKILGPPKPLI